MTDCLNPIVIPTWPYAQMGVHHDDGSALCIVCIAHTVDRIQHLTCTDPHVDIDMIRYRVHRRHC